MTEQTAGKNNNTKSIIHPQKSILELLAVLRTAGFSAFLVGGCVRDELLGRQPQDYDVTTSAAPAQIARLFPRVIPTGEAFGGVTVVTADGAVEVTAYRTESGYSDGRHPDGIAPAATLYEDVQRRDFTIGAMAWSPETGLIDAVGGVADLRAGLIRTVGDPRRRFAEDHLRILRALRFAAQLDFSIEPATRAAMLEMAGSVSTVSRERIGREIAKILASGRPSLLGVLADTGAFAALGIPAGADWPRLDTAAVEARFAGLCLLCGVQPRMLATALRRPNSEVRTAEELLAIAAAPLPHDAVDCKRLLSRHSAQALRDGFSLKEGETAEALLLLRAVERAGEPCTIAALAVRGEDLLAAGIPPREIGAMQKRLLEAVIQSPEQNTKERLLRLL